MILVVLHYAEELVNKIGKGTYFDMLVSPMKGLIRLTFYYENGDVRTIYDSYVHGFDKDNYADFLPHMQNILKEKIEEWK